MGGARTWPVAFAPPTLNPPKYCTGFFIKWDATGYPPLQPIASAPVPSHDTRGDAQKSEQAEREDAEAAEVQEPAGGEHAAAAVEERHVLLGPMQRVIVLGELERERAAPLPWVRAQRPLRRRQRYI
jgi:hypothetical protein